MNQDPSSLPYSRAPLADADDLVHLETLSDNLENLLLPAEDEEV